MKVWSICCQFLKIHMLDSNMLPDVRAHGKRRQQSDYCFAFLSARKRRHLWARAPMVLCTAHSATSRCSGLHLFGPVWNDRKWIHFAHCTSLPHPPSVFAFFQIPLSSTSALSIQFDSLPCYFLQMKQLDVPGKRLLPSSESRWSMKMRVSGCRGLPIAKAGVTYSLQWRGFGSRSFIHENSDGSLCRVRNSYVRWSCEGDKWDKTIGCDRLLLNVQICFNQKVAL